MTGGQLKIWRTQKGFSQADAADYLSASIHTVRSWEQGKNPIPQWVEKQTMQEADLRIPLELVVAINKLATERAISFDDAFQMVLKSGIHELGTQLPKSENNDE